MYADVKDFNWLKKIKSPNFESFSHEFPLPRPFETMSIENIRATLPVLQNIPSSFETTNEEGTEDVKQSYSSDDEL